ncbi:zinc finger BED domain-containing protein RICESLEEPER 2-like [Senna tora]|uniref:Zinc finger BED domain-containing protein RICESLEEPER 2-like n=1 Tax=Senna tora TaxID=362788 RepID=A0A834SYA0_9FABA|nr:zinc finger BED domain-containing protein RICESLEEPER 2-like [Senna tora]
MSSKNYKGHKTTVEHFWFKRYSENLQPSFNVPSRHMVKSDIMKIYEAQKVKSMGLLDKIGSRIVITTNLWIPSNQKKGFMAITSHFIDENWALQSRILRFAYLPCPHSAKSTSSTLVECFLDWNIDRKLSTINLDNCSTNDSLINLLLMKLDTSSLLLDGQLFHMRCCAHILSLIVQDGLAVIVDGISKVRSSVVFWSATPKREHSFREAALQLKILCTKKYWFVVHRIMGVVIVLDPRHGGGIKYPILQKMVRDILAIHISIVALESTFSTGGRLVSPHRSKLKEDTLEALMCSQTWICKEQQDLLTRYWTIEARVVRLWHLPLFSKNSHNDAMEMVLCDREGSKIAVYDKSTFTLKYLGNLKEDIIGRIITLSGVQHSSNNASNSNRLNIEIEDDQYVDQIVEFMIRHNSGAVMIAL